jgi:hypothetical protein
MSRSLWCRGDVVIRESGSDALCIGQASHAWISGQLARAWGNDRFTVPEPVEDLVLGAEQHDVGMAEWDVHPRLNPRTGRPMSFMEMPLDTHLSLWRAAPHKLLTQSPYAALVVSMHGGALYAKRDSMEPGSEESRAVRSYLAEQERLQRDILARTGAEPAVARFHQRLVWALDFLSLGLLLDWAPDSVNAPTRLGEDDAEITLLERTVDPWPFRPDELTVRCRGRRLSGGHESQESLDAAMDAAPWETLEFSLRRAG